MFQICLTPYLIFHSRPLLISPNGFLIAIRHSALNTLLYLLIIVRIDISVLKDLQFRALPADNFVARAVGALINFAILYKKPMTRKFHLANPLKKQIRL